MACALAVMFRLSAFSVASIMALFRCCLTMPSYPWSCTKWSGASTCLRLRYRHSGIDGQAHARQGESGRTDRWSLENVTRALRADDGERRSRRRGRCSVTRRLREEGLFACAAQTKRIPHEAFVSAGLSARRWSAFSSSPWRPSPLGSARTGHRTGRFLDVGRWLSGPPVTTN